MFINLHLIISFLKFSCLWTIPKFLKIISERNVAGFRLFLNSESFLAFMDIEEKKSYKFDETSVLSYKLKWKLPTFRFAIYNFTRYQFTARVSHAQRKTGTHEKIARPSVIPISFRLIAIPTTPYALYNNLLFRLRYRPLIFFRLFILIFNRSSLSISQCVYYIATRACFESRSISSVSCSRENRSFRPIVTRLLSLARRGLQDTAEREPKRYLFL